MLSIVLQTRTKHTKLVQMARETLIVCIKLGVGDGFGGEPVLNMQARGMALAAEFTTV